MKKLIKIIIVCVLITSFIIFLKNIGGEQKEPTPIASLTSQPQVENTQTAFDNSDCECESECLCSESDAECDCHRTKSTCTCTQKDGKVVTMESIETNNDEIEEENPEETSDEDETILSE